MEQPMDKIFTMVLFSLIKKVAVEGVTKSVGNQNIGSPPPDLYGYETDFITALLKKQRPPRRKLLRP